MPYQVNARLLAYARPHAMFMHCLPAHRGQEVTAEGIDGPASIVWQQAANRMPTEQALIYLLVTGSWDGHTASYPRSVASNHRADPMFGDIPDADALPD